MKFGARTNAYLRLRGKEAFHYTVYLSVVTSRSFISIPTSPLVFPLSK